MHKRSDSIFQSYRHGTFKWEDNCSKKKSSKAMTPVMTPGFDLTTLDS